MAVRKYDFLDHLVMNLDRGLNTLFKAPSPGSRPNPAKDLESEPLNLKQERLAASLMRINHAGEVSAQALYQGQALTARDPEVRASMQQSASEEIDHLNWCEERIDELGGHTSYLNPLWYFGSLTIGAVAGVCGDKWSLGFIAETEHQVVRHLQGHLQRLPEADVRSRAILKQMCEDEGHHATVAMASGGAPLPEPVRQMMHLTSQVMTRTAYWV